MLGWDHPALFVELDDSALRRLGSSVSVLIAWLGDQGYEPYRLTAQGPQGPLKAAQVLARQREKGYVDGFFLPQGHVPSGTSE